MHLLFAPLKFKSSEWQELELLYGDASLMAEPTADATPVDVVEKLAMSATGLVMILLRRLSNLCKSLAITNPTLLAHSAWTDRRRTLEQICA